MTRSSNEPMRFVATPAGELALVKGAPAPWEVTDIGQSLERIAAHSPNKVGFIHEGQTLTYGELLEQANALAAGLVELGLEPGEATAVLLDNSLEWIICFYGLALVGSPTIPVNTRLIAEEISYVLEHSGAALLIAGEKHGRSNLAETLAQIKLADPQTAKERFGQLRQVIQVGGVPAPGCKSWQDTLQTNAAPVRLGGPDSIGLVQYTSGTTGFPKGVMLTQNQILRNAHAVGTRLGARSNDVMYSPMPFFHVGGAVLSVLLTATHGATLIFPRRFSAEHMLTTIDEYKCTLTAGVETMLLALQEHPLAETFSGASIRGAWGAGLDEIFEFLPGFVSIYGLSENSPNAAMAYFDESLHLRRDTCGWVQSDVELGIADPDATGEPVWRHRGEVGEIRIRGWSVMQGYLNDAGATARTIDEQGWLHTGDLGLIDEHSALHFEGRIYDTIRIGGEVVAAREIERVLGQHENVRAAHAVGIADNRYGEVPFAFIETVDGLWDTRLENELKTLAQTGLAAFKMPRGYLPCDDVPLTESGKVQKRLLTERYLAPGKP